MRPIPLLALLALLPLACRSSQPSEPSSSKPTPAAPADAAPADAAPLSDAEKAQQREARATAALARIPEISAGLAKLRGLELRGAVTAELQSTADFRTFLRASIDSELPAALADDISTAYTQLGLLERKLDLRKTLEDAMVSQAGAYYDPKAKKFFMVMVPSSDLMFDTISAHELTHALQDQHFDLQAYYDPKSPQLRALGEDAMNARRFIVEGEATLTMLAYTVGAMTKQDALAPAFRPALKMQLGAMAKLGIDQLKDMTKQQQGGFLDMDADIRASIEAMDDIPLALMLPLLESYTRGALPVFAAYEHGGWKEVDKLYAQPPESTEQVLHPDTKLYPTRDLPKAVTLPRPPRGYRQVYSETLGELMWRVYFLLWDKPASEPASAGWDGDRYVVLRNERGELLTWVATTWDSEAEAEEFEAAYRRSLVKRFGGDGSKRPEGAPVLVQRRGSDVFVVDGLGADQLMPTLLKGSKIK